MEVTHLSDYDTHAVMGGGQTKGFGILNTAEFITVLSSTLYSDAFLAVIREVVCNAWDAHKMVNKQDVPVEITLNQTELVIRDFGPGIDPTKMVDIYCTYGNSTKKQQENQTGGFGLGSKSPFAYTNFFTVTVNYKGTKTIWAVSRGSADTNGMPDIRDMWSGPTDDVGVEVNIPLSNPEDTAKFTKVINDVVAWGEINANLNGKLIVTIPISQAKEGIFFSSSMPPTVNGRLYVRYGNVVYPIPNHREYEDLYQGASRLLERTNKIWQIHGGYESSSGTHGLNVFFEAAPNTISVVPSREAIHTSDRTIATVKAMLQQFVDACGNLGSPEYALKHELEIMSSIMEKKDSRAILGEENLIADYYSNYHSNGASDKYRTMQGHFFSVEEVVIAMASRGFIFNDDSVLDKARKQRIEYIIQNDKTDVDLFMKLVKLLNREPDLWKSPYYNPRQKMYVHLQYSGLLSKASTAKLNPRSFYMWDRHGYPGRNAFAGGQLLKLNPELRYLAELSRRRVMIVSSMGQVCDHTRRHNKPIPNWDKVNDGQTLVYILPRGTSARGKFFSKKQKPEAWANYEETLKFFQKNNYEIIDIVGFYNTEYPPKPKAPKGTRIMASAGDKKKAFKRKTNTYPSIKYLLDPKTGSFDRNRAKHVYNKDMPMLSNYDLVFKGHDLRENSHGKRFFKWGNYHEELIVKEYGDRAVFVKTDAEKDKLILAGAKDGESYVIQDVCNRLLQDADFKKSIENANIWRRIWIDEDDYKTLKTKTIAGGLLPDIEVIPDIAGELYEFFKHLEYRRSCMEHNTLTIWDNTIDTIKQWRVNRKPTAFEAFFTDEKKSKFHLIQAHTMLQSIDNGKFSSPEEEAFIESVLIQVFS